MLKFVDAASKKPKNKRRKMEKKGKTLNTRAEDTSEREWGATTVENCSGVRAETGGGSS